MGEIAYSAGTIRKHKNYDGSWEWQACINATENKKRRQLRKMTGIPCDPKKRSESGSGRRTAPTGKGARQAQAFLLQWRSDLIAQEQPTQTSTGMSVLEFLDYYWGTRSVSQVTMDGYSNLRKHIDHPALRKTINELQPADVQTWIDTKLKDGVGAPTIKKAFDQLNFACRWGVRMQQLTSNPCDPITPPKKARREPNPLDEASIERLNVALDNLRDAGETQACLADAAKLSLLTGMRLGELCGLAWNDIDGGANGELSADGYIHINNVVTMPKGGAVLKPYPKNKERRDIPLNPQVLELLKTRRASFEAIEGHNLKKCYVFARPTSAKRFASTDYIGHKWNAFISMTGLRGAQGLVPHFHDLRHTFATQALVHGIDIVTVAAILGHRDTSTTLRYYARWMPNANKDAMNKIGDILA